MTADGFPQGNKSFSIANFSIAKLLDFEVFVFRAKDEA